MPDLENPPVPLSAPIIERAPLPIVEVCGPTHTVSSVSAAFCRLVGKSRAELVGQAFEDIVPGGKSCVPVLDQVYQTGESVTHSVRDPSERAYWLYAIWPALNADERPVGAIIQLTKSAGPGQDAAAVNEALLLAALRQHEQIEVIEELNVQLQSEIVERHRAESDLRAAVDQLTAAQKETEAASRAKDDFLAALSHDLRTPLNPALMAAGELKQDERIPPDARELCEMIERNISLEARLIDDLLDLTKIAQGKLHFRPEPCDAHGLIDLAIEIVRADAQAKLISLNRELDAPQHMVMADPTRFQQVVWNLLRNAVKFTPAGGRITVRTGPGRGAIDGPSLRIEVADSGVGIMPTSLEQIFRPFDQSGLGAVHQFGGVGLGLAIARAVIDMHGGQIRAESEGPGQGATFVVEMPALPGPPAIAAESAALAARSPVVPRRILLVEDHETSALVISELLRRDGHTVKMALTSAAALSAAGAGTFDLVIADLGLPDGSGVDLMKKLRETYGLPGVALSGYGADEDLVRSRAAGFKMHLLKPISMVELRAALASQAPPQSEH